LYIYAPDIIANEHHLFTPATPSSPQVVFILFRLSERKFLSDVSFPRILM